MDEIDKSYQDRERENKELVYEETAKKFIKLMHVCEKDGEVIMRKPKGKDSYEDEMFNRLGYSLVYEKEEYIGYDYKMVTDYYTSGYSGTISDTGSVSLSENTSSYKRKEYYPVTRKKIFARWVKVVEKGAAKNEIDEEEKIIKNAGTYSQISNGLNETTGNIKPAMFFICDLLVFLAYFAMFFFQLRPLLTFTHPEIQREYLISNGLLFGLIVALSIICVILWCIFVNKYRIKNSHFETKKPIKSFADLILVLTPLTLAGLIICGLQLFFPDNVEELGMILLIVFAALTLVTFVNLVGRITYRKLSKAHNARKQMVESGDYKKTSEKITLLAKHSNLSILKEQAKALKLFVTNENYRIILTSSKKYSDDYTDEIIERVHKGKSASKVKNEAQPKILINKAWLKTPLGKYNENDDFSDVKTFDEDVFLKRMLIARDIMIKNGVYTVEDDENELYFYKLNVDNYILKNAKKIIALDSAQRDKFWSEIQNLSHSDFVDYIEKYGNFSEEF